MPRLFGFVVEQQAGCLEARDCLQGLKEDGLSRGVELLGGFQEGLELVVVLDQRVQAILAVGVGAPDGDVQSVVPVRVVWLGCWVHR